MISQIYNQLKVSHLTGGSLHSLQKLMDPIIRNRFMNVPMHLQITEEMNFINQATSQLIE
jgi:hypothetical protein